MHREKEMIERITSLMQKRNITAQKLTSELGISRTAVSEWKAGRTEPSVNQVRLLAEYFNVSTDYIINGAETERVVLSDKDLEREMDTSMYDVFVKLNREHKQAVRDFFYLCLSDIAAKNEKIDANHSEDATEAALSDFEERLKNGEFGKFDPNA